MTPISEIGEGGEAPNINSQTRSTKDAEANSTKTYNCVYCTKQMPKIAQLGCDDPDLCEEEKNIVYHMKKKNGKKYICSQDT